MLATGGLLGLLLMGAAVGGLVTGMDGSRDDPDTDDRPGDRAETEEAFDLADDADLRADLIDGTGDTDAEPPRLGVEHSSLGRLLFGSPPHWEQAHWTEAAHQDTRFDAVVQASAASSTPMAAAPAPIAHLDVQDTIILGCNPAIPLVTGFDASTDRLILDFPGTASDAPEITVDLRTSPGDALIRADGMPVTFVAGATTLSTAHIDIVMSDADLDMPPGPPPGPAIGSFPALGVIHHFDPATQQIEIDYDPVVFRNPEIDIRASRDGTGADILLNGEIVLSVAGTRSLDPDLVVLRPV